MITVNRLVLKFYSLCQENILWEPIIKKNKWNWDLHPSGSFWTNIYFKRIRTMRKATEIWDKLECRLPKVVLSTLLPPAKGASDQIVRLTVVEEDIDEAEDILQIHFPEELRCSLMVHNGQETLMSETNLGLIFGCKLLTVQEIVTEKLLLKDSVDIPVTYTLGFSKVIIIFLKHS